MKSKYLANLIEVVSSKSTFIAHMHSLLRKHVFDSPYVKDAANILFFGALSGLLSKVGVGDSNLREIPLLIGLFHIGNPVFIIPLNLFTLINSPSEVSYWAVYAVHMPPLLISWVSFRLLRKKELSNIFSGMASIIVTVVYYVLLLLPLVVITLQFTLNDGKGFWESYLPIVKSSEFEIITSSLVVGFYLIQLESRKTLEHNNKNLEQIVKRRTIELTSANNELQSLNEELKASNDSIKELNENLEQLVKERTDRINDQLTQLRRYAHMNSHELRAPLARMLGLLQLLRQEKDPEQMKELLKYLHSSSEELDGVIREMNRILEKEIVF